MVRGGQITFALRLAQWFSRARIILREGGYLIWHGCGDYIQESSIPKGI
jgi:hypothetical protein